MRVLLALFFVLNSVAAIANDRMETGKTIDADNHQFTSGQLNMMCDAMWSNFGAVRFKAKEYSGKAFTDVYPYIKCKNMSDNFRSWHLLGHSLTRPPSTRAFMEANRMLRELSRQGETELLRYMFTHKDELGRTIYDHLELMKRKVEGEDKYYRKFEKLFNKYDLYTGH